MNAHAAIFRIREQVHDDPSSAEGRRECHTLLSHGNTNNNDDFKDDEVGHIMLRHILKTKSAFPNAPRFWIKELLNGSVDGQNEHDMVLKEAELCLHAF